jgi:prolyl-tRNA synthetase
MKFSQSFIRTLREVPADALIPSHRLMFRAGMIRKIANGLFAYLPVGLRSFRKVESIIRAEMNGISALEIKPPVVVPGELWKESGRWDSMGEELLRMKNRLGIDFVFSPTAEEAFSALVRDELSSYRQLPLLLYQINTKYRDEIRPRYGFMRSREFTMKDAYSFHSDDASLDKTYQAMGRAYRRIFSRCGLTVIPVRADSGSMGGSDSEEFMVESTIGDSTLLLCRSCHYAANVEKAACTPEPIVKLSSVPAVETVQTPAVKTIDELCAFLGIGAESFIKTLIYRVVNAELADGTAFYAVCIRGDLSVNETKLAAFLKAQEVMLADDADVVRLTCSPVGFAGPVGLTGLPIIADNSVVDSCDLVTGALAPDLHFRHVVYGRDWTAQQSADLRTVKAGDRCPLCAGELYEKKGNELGHIFKLGYKYTKSMHITYLDEAGQAHTPIMGCYGVGLDRTLASIIEEHHDEAGIIWPLSVAPYHVIIIPIQYTGAVKTAADELADTLEKQGIEVLLDDRSERAGVKFNDADLIGIPYRVVVGDKNLPLFEIKRRDEKESRLISLPEVVQELCAATSRLSTALVES